MSIWGLTVIVALAIAMLSMLGLIWLQKRQKEAYSHCFWKGFLTVFLLIIAVFVTLKITGVIQKAMLYGLPIAFGAGSLAGLLTEIIRNRMLNRNFWRKC
jgi:hypothetical protein